MINISDLDKAEVLATLYNNTHPQGLGFLHFDPTPMTKEDAQKLLDECEKCGYFYFDYLYGRVMKVDLAGENFDPRLYDRDNYQGAAQDAINKIRKNKGE